MKATTIIIIIHVLKTIPKRLIRALKEIEIGGRAETIQTIKIDQDIEKSPGNLRRLAVTQTPVKDHLLKVEGKTCK